MLRPNATEPVPEMITMPAPKPTAPVSAMRASVSTMKLPRGKKMLQRVDDALAMHGMIGAGDAAVGVLDVADGDAGLDEGDVHGALDVARRFFDPDAQVIRRARQTAPERLAVLIHDERGGFRGAAVDADEVSHAAASVVQRRVAGQCPFAQSNLH